MKSKLLGNENISVIIDDQLSKCEYMAKDKDGKWYAYELKPKLKNFMCMWVALNNNSYRMYVVELTPIDWLNSLIKISDLKEIGVKENNTPSNKREPTINELKKAILKLQKDVAKIDMATNEISDRLDRVETNKEPFHNLEFKEENQKIDIGFKRV